MKLTTKLLKEMIHQEMKHMEYGGDVFEPEPPVEYKYFKAPMDNPEQRVEIDKDEYDRLVAMGGTQQDSFEADESTVFI